MKTVEMPKMGDTMEEGKICAGIKKEASRSRGEPWRKIED